MQSLYAVLIIKIQKCLNLDIELFRWCSRADVLVLASQTGYGSYEPNEVENLSRFGDFEVIFPQTFFGFTRRKNFLKEYFIGIRSNLLNFFKY